MQAVCFWHSFTSASPRFWLAEQLLQFMCSLFIGSFAIQAEKCAFPEAWVFVIIQIFRIKSFMSSFATIGALVLAAVSIAVNVSITEAEKLAIATDEFRIVLSSVSQILVCKACGRKFLFASEAFGQLTKTTLLAVFTCQSCRMVSFPIR